MSPPQRTILILDDLAPHPRYGAGYGRTNDIVSSLVKLNYRVGVYVRGHRPLDKFCAGFWPHGNVHILYQQRISLDEVLQKLGASLQAVWVSRLTNVDKYAQLLWKWKESFPKCLLIADTEALASLRKLSGKLDVYDQENLETLLPFVAKELKAAHGFDFITCVNQYETDLATRIDHGSSVVRLGHAFTFKKTNRDFNKRRHYVFLGAFHTNKAPNMGSVVWFCENVWPKIKAEHPEAEFHIAGYMAKCISFPESVLAHAQVIGPVSDLATFMAKYRVFVAPTRLAAGIPHKVHQAMSMGLPSVISDILAKQLGLERQTTPFLHALSATDFAEKCIELYRDESLWARVQADAVKEIEETCSPEYFDSTIRHLTN